MVSPSATRRPLPEAVRAALQQHFGERFTQNASILAQHGADESHYAPTPPDAVVFALSSEDVAFAVKTCAAQGVPVIAFGVGSSIEGHVLAVHGGVCIDLSRMDQVLAVRPEDMTATVQAGVTRMALNAELAHSGFFFSVDPGANASIGGMVATAASGTNTVRYGTMRDNVLSLTVVTAEGAIIRTASHARKSSAGYNLTQLYCGSEGTLGIVTEATVRLHPRPEEVLAAVANFPDIKSAVDAVIQAVQLGLPLARAEMLDALTIRAINRHSKTSLAEAPTLFLEFGGAAGEAAAQAEQMQQIVRDCGGGDFKMATREEERSALWTPRHHAYFAVLQLRPGSRSLTTDACVPVSRLAECIEETRADLEASGLVAPIFGHVGDGNFHCLILVDPANEAEREVAEALSQRLTRRAMAHGGTCTGEHGVGLHKIGYLAEEHGEAAVDIMRRVKQALDPKNILNPGKVVLLPFAPGG
ncbi:FAD-binding oxidoreductase [Pseudorhodoferax sp. Leaf267]|uniref:FAD-binding oxidoreductase n=1 Tax=Pseudorhodoferax sp. Leaf267 TaxID=1736316 RepID=UPI0006F5DEC7|nr:FAD-linked oxidase C-terminal domain-containing protein [Pseudorhodoferax sp. Leaf267]KQP22945.1 2-hydroxy-acid oxidase [Pseudorhodoferax sp. Leaf267]